MNRMLKRAQQKLQKVSKGAKVAVTGVAASAFSSAANAAVTFDETAGFSGSIDTKYYLTAVGIVVVFLGVSAAIVAGIRAFKKA